MRFTHIICLDPSASIFAIRLYHMCGWSSLKTDTTYIYTLLLLLLLMINTNKWSCSISWRVIPYSIIHKTSTRRRAMVKRQRNSQLGDVRGTLVSLNNWKCGIISEFSTDFTWKSSQHKWSFHLMLYVCMLCVVY